MISDPHRSGFSLKIAAGVFFVVCLAGSFFAVTPPDPVDANAPASEFSGIRALRHLPSIARTPRPTGTREAAVVGEYLLAQLAGMGLETTIQTTQAMDGRRRAAGMVTNIGARLKGSEPGRAVLLTAHYDSVTAGPGASDDAAAVAALLETMRALHSSPRLKHDVICLFADGEEAALLGSNAFAGKHPWAKDAGLVLNFEARGTSGPSMLFETSTNNGWLIRHLAHAVPRPVGASLFSEVYRFLPNDTDMEVYLRAGKMGMNFAYIGNSRFYHTRLDDLGHVDARSLQHHGSYALALARDFSNAADAAARESDAVYFDVLSLFLVRYPAAFRFPLAVAALVAFLVVTTVFRHRLSLAACARGFGLLGISLIAAPLAGTALWSAIALAAGNSFTTITGDVHQSPFFWAAIVFLTLAIMTFLWRRLRRKADLLALSLGTLFWWLILCVASTLFLPGGSYLFVWPLFFSLAGLSVLAGMSDGWAGAYLYMVCLVPGMALFLPLIVLLADGLTVSFSAPVTVLIVLATSSVLPVLEWLGATTRRSSAALCVLSVLMLGVALARSGASTRQPRPDMLFYHEDADHQKAVWASTDRQPDAWTAKFLSASPERADLGNLFANRHAPLLINNAPLLPAAAPAIEVLGDEVDGNVRTIRMNVKSLRAAPQMTLAVGPDTRVLRGFIQNEPMPAAFFDAANAGWWELVYFAPPPEGIDLQLQCRPGSAVVVKLFDRSYALPDLAVTREHPRPPATIATQFSRSDQTFVSRTVYLKKNP